MEGEEEEGDDGFENEHDRSMDSPHHFVQLLPF